MVVAFAMTLDDTGALQSGEGLAEALVSHMQACAQIRTRQRMAREHKGIDDGPVEPSVASVAIARRIVRSRGLGELEMDIVLAGEQKPERIGRWRAAVLDAE